MKRKWNGECSPLSSSDKFDSNSYASLVVEWNPTSDTGGLGRGPDVIFCDSCCAFSLYCLRNSRRDCRGFISIDVLNYNVCVRDTYDTSLYCSTTSRERHPDDKSRYLRTPHCQAQTIVSYPHLSQVQYLAQRTKTFTKLIKWKLAIGRERRLVLTGSSFGQLEYREIGTKTEHSPSFCVD